MSEHPFNVEKYHEGIELFNDVEFFEAHDAWETFVEQRSYLSQALPIWNLSARHI